MNYVKLTTDNLNYPRALRGEDWEKLDFSLTSKIDHAAYLILEALQEEAEVKLDKYQYIGFAADLVSQEPPLDSRNSALLAGNLIMLHSAQEVLAMGTSK